jgi:hypothetical protein
MTALAELVAAPFLAEPRIVARRLLSMLAALAILTVALPTALGGGTWGGGVDPGRFFAPAAPAATTHGSTTPPSVPIRSGHGSDSRQTRREAGTQS